MVEMKRLDTIGWIVVTFGESAQNPFDQVYEQKKKKLYILISLSCSSRLLYTHISDFLKTGYI